MAAMLDALRAAAHPVALTGAGISAPSGVPTFQSLWKGRPIRDFLGRSYYERDPIGFFALYCAMEAWCRAEPNAAHRALAALGVPVITQNIDGLHQKAGSKRTPDPATCGASSAPAADGSRTPKRFASACARTMRPAMTRRFGRR